jgi:hypothetical protein
MADIIVAGNTSGSITISAPLVAGSGTLTLPTGTDTLIGKATVDTLTNKTLTSPVLTTPALGAATATSLTVSGDVLITSANVLGYSTGSGGTVTQATSKGTAVTLNKPTGVITMNAASLGANTSVQFQMNNTFSAANDTIVLTANATLVAMTSYQWGAATNGAGGVVIYLRNITAGALAEAVVFNFAIIKGATS